MGAAIVAVGLAVAVGEPVIGVFGVVLALNQLLGGGEHAPFSRYVMFSNPKFRSLAVVLEDADGQPRPARHFGVVRSAPTKRWRTAVADARRDGRKPVRAQAAADVVAWVRARRPQRGRSARGPTKVVLYEYGCEDGELVRKRTELGVIEPR